MRIIILSVMAVCFLCACAQVEVGKKFDTQAANRIEIGKTTEREVLAWLGEPLQKVTREDGTKVYGYGYKEASTVAGPFYAKGTASGERLLIKFNPQGVVIAVARGSLPDRRSR